MVLPTGTISMSQVNTELGRSSTASISLNETAVRNLAGIASGTISMNDLRGKSAVTFTPDGGTAPGGSAPTLVNNDTYSTSLSVSCSQSAVWTYSGGGTGSSVSISSGASATSITFYLSTSYAGRTASWALSATSGGVTRYWNIYLEVFGIA